VAKLGLLYCLLGIAGSPTGVVKSALSFECTLFLARIVPCYNTAMLGSLSPLFLRSRLLAHLIFLLLLANLFSGCSEIDNLEKTHEALVTLQEADRQFSIENTADGSLPDDRQAIIWINRAIVLLPHSAVLYTGNDTDGDGLITILTNRGRYPLLISYLKKAAADRDLANNTAILLSLAEAEERSGPSAVATAAYARALASINKSMGTSGSIVDADGNLLLNRAESEYYGGERAQSIMDFKSIIGTRDDLRATAQNNLAYDLALDKTDLPWAKQLATAAVASARTADNDDQLGIYIDTLAWVVHQQGNNSDALTYEEEAASLTPLQADVQYHLGEICRASGKYFEARVAYRTAVKLNPYFPEARASLSSLPTATSG
jgi:tetratricopeptide (TPR) repeat protein